MYDELIKRLRECTAEQNGEKTLWHQAADAIEELQKQLREEKVDNVNLTGWLAEEHSKHLWIPVTERLPEDEQNVLVAYKTTDKTHLCQYHADGSNNRWYSYIDQCRAYNNVVLAWMPLPQPPESEGE